MDVVCTIVVAILCINAPPTGTVVVSEANNSLQGFYEIIGPGFAAGSSFTEWRRPHFVHAGASRVCVGQQCLDYHRACTHNAPAVRCAFDLDGDQSFYLSAGSDAEMQVALQNIAIGHESDGRSSFPLSLFDGSIPAPEPEQK